MNRFFTLLFVASCLTAVGQDFDGLTQAFTTDSSLFLTSEDYLSWDSAEAFAASLGGHLATFVSTAENLEVVPSVNSNGGTGGYWFGLRQDVNGTEPNEGWGWATGESLTFTYWNSSEPNNVNGVEDCGELYSNGTWNDADCEVLKRFVVEVTLHAGCADQQACNFDSQANFDDGSCHFNCQFCHDGTVWDEDLFKCIVANPSDSNFDGCVQLNDLLDLLSAYGDCGAEESPWQCGDPLEYQGHGYETVQIGEQCWFAENLRIESYENGDAIPAGLNSSEWTSTTSGATVIYDGNASNLEAYGRLYNWHAVDDARSLCPSTWRIPSDGEWTTLTNFLGGAAVAGGQMKTTYGWNGDGNGTNSSGFSGLPGGSFASNGNFNLVGSSGYWWSASPYGSSAWYRIVSYNDEAVTRNFAYQRNGYSVRCVRDAE